MRATRLNSCEECGLLAMCVELECRCGVVCALCESCYEEDPVRMDRLMLDHQRRMHLAGAVRYKRRMEV